MATHYETLGVNKDASPDEIKKAFRRLASQHHPDKGGDTQKFQEIQVAYDTLSDPQKKAAYDNPAPQFGNEFNQSGMPPGFEDVINQMFGGGFNPFGNGFNFRNAAQPQRNRTLNIQTTITLEDAFYGKDLVANITLPTGRDQILQIKIPAGVQDGTTLRLSGMGDDSIPNMPRGDIHLTVNVQPNKIFQRTGDDLNCTLNLSCIDAMVGKKINIQTIDEKTLELTIKPGTQHGQVMAAAGYGMPKMSDNRYQGRLLIHINIIIPDNLTDAQKQILKEHFQ
jgi:curved DNA-binding protein